MDNRTVNERLVYARKKRGLRQIDVSEKIHIARNSYCLIETGKNSFTDRTIYDVCRVLNINEEWLRTGEGEMDAVPTDELAPILNELAVDRDTDFGRLIASAMHTYYNAPKEVKAALDAWLKQTLDDYTKKGQA